MKTSVVMNRVNRIFIGSILWGIFYLNIFYSVFNWNNTLFGELFTGSYSYAIIYSIKAVFFIAVSINLYLTTVGKSNGIINLGKILNVVIFTSMIVLVIQWFILINNYAFHFGLFGYIFGNPSYSKLLDLTDVTIFVIYTIGNVFEYIFIAGIIVYLYQLYKMSVTLDFMYYVRIGVILIIYLACLGITINGFDTLTMVFSIGYILCGVFVYIRSKYSLGLMYLSIILLLII